MSGFQIVCGNGKNNRIFVEVPCCFVMFQYKSQKLDVHPDVIMEKILFLMGFQNISKKKLMLSFYFPIIAVENL